MVSDNIRNNDSLLLEMKTIVLHGNIHHGYILEGPATADKEAVAMHFVRSILCREAYVQEEKCNCLTCRKIHGGNHMDVMVLRATKSEGSKVESVKEGDVERLQERLKTKPLEGERNIALICDADTMTRHAFNKLLKTLEEPPVGTVIILLSENIFHLPETVRSRCISLRVNSWETGKEMGDEKIAAELVSLLLAGAPYYRLKKAMDPVLKKDRKEIFSFLDAMEENYRSKLPQATGASMREDLYEGVHRVEQAREEIKNNMNSTYAIKKMALAIGGQ